MMKTDKRKPNRGRRPSSGGVFCHIQKLKADICALQEAYDRLAADHEALRISVARLVTTFDNDLNMLSEF